MNKITSIISFEKDINLLYQTINSLVSNPDIAPEIILVGDTALKLHEQSICEKYKSFDIYLLVLPDGTTVPEQFNKGANMATGDFLSFYHTGSIASPEELHSMITVINGQPNLTWCYGISQINIDGTKEIVPPLDWAAHKKEGLIFPYQFGQQKFNFQSMLVPKKIFVDSNGFSPDYAFLYGTEFFLRLALFYRPVFWSKTIVETFNSPLSMEQEIHERLLLLYEFLEPAEKMGLKNDYLSSILKNISRYNLWKQFNNLLNVLSNDFTCKTIIEEFLDNVFVEQKIVPSLVPNVSGVNDCVGCGSCSHRCPSNAITMQYNKEGFLYPVIDTTLCTNCGECLSYCPTQNKLASSHCQDKCLAINADDIYREKSSSGGIFPMLGEFFINNGGYVAGAVYDDTLKYGVPHVHHIVTNDLNTLEKMRSSKYVQSDTTQIYPQIQELLDNGKSVFFTGCACQIAGLKAYLHKDYPNLFTADVVCHGVPSPMVFENYIQELYEAHGEIEEINFRMKSEFDWNVGLYVKFQSGYEISQLNSYPYVYGFLSNWFLRKSCYDCRFKSKKYSDISLGDFWGIQQLSTELSDNKGTSVVELNTQKGLMLYKEILGKVENKMFIPVEYAIPSNICIRHSVPSCKFREQFFTSWQKNKVSLAKAIDHGCDNVHFDVAMVLMWSVNHGNAITNYALYKTVEKYCSVMVIDNCSTLHPKERFRIFADKYYQCSSTYFPDDRLDLIMDHCDTLLTGSDQIWNYQFESIFKYKQYYQLDFAKDNDKIRKVAYSSSFGDYKQVPPPSLYLDLYQQFDKISVRDIFGPKAFNEIYNLDAEFVLDPVFLLDEKEYDCLIDTVPVSTRESEPFILSYILNPTKEKRASCKKIQQQLGNIKIINVCEGNSGNNEYSQYILEFDNIKLNVTVEDWLYYLKNAQFVITDSFHGTCLSVYFKKKFVSFVNRQSDRFLWFKELGEPYDHIISDITDENILKSLSPIDYTKVWSILNKERERSLKWLEDALFCEKAQ